MPIYEYLCQDCRTRFEVLRPMKDADTPIECQQCGGAHTVRCLALFNACWPGAGAAEAAAPGARAAPAEIELKKIRLGRTSQPYFFNLESRAEHFQYPLGQRLA